MESDDQGVRRGPRGLRFPGFPAESFLSLRRVQDWKVCLSVVPSWVPPLPVAKACPSVLKSSGPPDAFVTLGVSEEVSMDTGVACRLG